MTQSRSRPLDSAGRTAPVRAGQRAVPPNRPDRCRQISTPVGTARVETFQPRGQPHGCLILGHGAGGGFWSEDLLTLSTLTARGWQVLLVEQPWRVAGKKVAPRPVVLDTAWLAVLSVLATSPEDVPRPWVVGGRSAGARVACRTAPTVAADAVLALAFPLHPPGRPERSRAEELAIPLDAGLPLLVVQGDIDPFGRPQEVLEVTNQRAPVATAAVVQAVAGGHGFRAPMNGVLDATAQWLAARWE